MSTQRAGMGREVGAGLKRVGTCAHPQLMLADARQKATPYYKAIILRLKTKTLKLKGKEDAVPRKVIYSWEMTRQQQSGTLESYVPRETNPPEKNRDVKTGPSKMLPRAV